MRRSSGVSSVLAGIELLVILGKGGVGKTAVAAAISRAAARGGRRVLVIEVDLRESLHTCFGASPSAGEPVDVGAGRWSLRFLNLKPRAALDAFVEDRLHFGPWNAKVLASAAYQRFAESAPGLPEMALLGQARRILRGEIGAIPGVDLVVIDAPATGHGLALLEAPGLVAQTVRDGPFGRMGAELAAWVRDSRRAAVALVALPEELPVQETLETVRHLRARLGCEPLAVFLNSVLQPSNGGSWPDPETERRFEAWAESRAGEAARLRAGWQGPLVELPFVPAAFGPALSAALTGPIEAWWARAR